MHVKRHKHSEASNVYICRIEAYFETSKMPKREKKSIFQNYLIRMCSNPKHVVEKTIKYHDVY